MLVHHLPLVGNLCIIITYILMATASVGVCRFVKGYEFIKMNNHNKTTAPHPMCSHVDWRFVQGIKE